MNTNHLDEEQLYYKKKYLKYKKKYLVLKKELYYKNKYLKYKNKYLVFKKQLKGGFWGDASKAVSDTWSHATQAVGDTVGHATKAVDNTTKAVGNASDAFIKTFNDKEQAQPMRQQPQAQSQQQLQSQPIRQQPQAQAQSQQQLQSQPIRQQPIRQEEILNKNHEFIDRNVKETGSHHKQNNKIINFIVYTILNNMTEYFKKKENLNNKIEINYHQLNKYICEYYADLKKAVRAWNSTDFKLYNMKPLTYNNYSKTNTEMTALTYLLYKIMNNSFDFKSTHAIKDNVTIKQIITFLEEEVKQFIREEHHLSRTVNRYENIELDCKS